MSEKWVVRYAGKHTPRTPEQIEELRERRDRRRQLDDEFSPERLSDAVEEAREELKPKKN